MLINNFLERINKYGDKVSAKSPVSRPYKISSCIAKGGSFDRLPAIKPHCACGWREHQALQKEVRIGSFIEPYAWQASHDREGFAIKSEKTT